MSFLFTSPRERPDRGIRHWVLVVGPALRELPRGWVGRQPVRWGLLLASGLKNSFGAL